MRTGEQAFPGRDSRAAWAAAREGDGYDELEALTRSLGDGVVRLGDDLTGLLRALPELGPVRARTDSRTSWVEQRAVFCDVRLRNGRGRVVSGPLNLRLFLHHWAIALAVFRETEAGLERSLRFFGRDGALLHRVTLEPDAPARPFRAVLRRHMHPDQSALRAAARRGGLAACPPRLAGRVVTAAAVRAAWAALESTRRLSALRSRFGLSHLEILRLLGSPFARAVTVRSARQVLVAERVPGQGVLVQIGNPGVLQLHPGPLRDVEARGPWLRAHASDGALALREDRIAEAWVVRTPCESSHRTCLELFDADGAPVAFLFGQRNAGEPEPEPWRELLAGLPAADARSSPA